MNYSSSLLLAVHRMIPVDSYSVLISDSWDFNLTYYSPSIYSISRSHMLNWRRLAPFWYDLDTSAYYIKIMWTTGTILLDIVISILIAYATIKFVRFHHATFNLCHFNAFCINTWFDKTFCWLINNAKLFCRFFFKLFTILFTDSHGFIL